MSDRETITSDVSFGAWVQQRRKFLDLTQADLAKSVGCSISTVRKIESDQRRPSRQVSKLIAEHLDLSGDQLDLFTRVARGQLRVDRLPSPSSGIAGRQGRTSSNLPMPLTALVGREPELGALADLVNEPRCRLLTLIGPGGIGKTRLALDLALRHQDLYPDGAHFVPLASVASSVFIGQAIADALGFVFQGQIEPRTQLLNHLRTKVALLVLDNIEHLLDDTELITELLEYAADLKLLVTSRARVNLQGEWIFEIHGLPVPPEDAVDRAEEYSAAALFVQCARRVKPDFALAEDDRYPVTHICQMVEGMPLGIELAAAWVSVLSCREIASEIEQNMDFLKTSMHNVPERLRSLRAAFDHSWKLLPTDERDVLCRLAVFKGGFDRQASEQIADATLTSLLSLVSKSLVRHKGDGRYDLHEVIRQYAQTHLASDPESESTVRDRHSIFYLRLVRDRETAIKGVDQTEAIRELTDDIDNIRAAWNWAAKSRQFGLIGEALRGFALLCDLGGWLRQGIEQISRVAKVIDLEPKDEEQQAIFAQAIAQQGHLLLRLGRFNQAQSLFEQSLGILRPIGNPVHLVDPLIFSGIIMHLCGDIERALSLLGEGLACAQAAGDDWFFAYARFNQGYITSLTGHYTEGFEQMRSGLGMWRSLGDPRYTALGLNFISPTAIKLGHHEEAVAYLQESLSLCEKVGDRWGTGTAYRNLGLASLSQGDFVEARSLIQKSLNVFTEFVTGWDIVQSLIYLGEVEIAAGEWSEARQIYLDALRLGVDARVTPLVLDALMGLARLQARAGKSDQALAYSLCVLDHRASTHETKDRASQLIKQLESEMSSHQFDVVVERSRLQILETIIPEILGEADPNPSHQE
jgi:predicted ATPase/transcriptional regulator with XRE-family HTH domain